MMTESKRRNQIGVDLPDELIMKILLLLPFETVLACKRLSKQWRNLINDPSFAKYYRHNGSMIVLFNKAQLYCVLIRDSNEISEYPSYTVHRIPIGLNKLKCESCDHEASNHELLSGWSNGIACVKAPNGHFVTYNLITGASHTVKNAPLYRHSKYWMYYGFGYDRFDDDYKIVVVCDYEAWTRDSSMIFGGERCDIEYVWNKGNSLFWVYSLRNRSWKSYDGFPHEEYIWTRSPWREGAYYLNGVLHCAIQKRGGGSRVIVTYDLHTRRFGEILAPPFHGRNVTELDGRLCYGYKLHDEWVIEVHGVGGSWTKLFVIDGSVTRDFSYMALYECGDGRKVGLLVRGGILKWYDFRDDEIEEVDVTTILEQQTLMKPSEHTQRMTPIRQYVMKRQ